MPKVTVKAPVQRTVIYPELSVEVCIDESALNAERAKDILGWREEGEKEKFGTDYLLMDRNGKKVRCDNNKGNRPFYGSWADTLAQEHLNKRWELNGETVVIGKTGLVLSAQHRLISLVLAQQTRVGKDAEHWDKIWGKDTEVTMPTIIVCGVEEADKVVNTLDTGKPRTLADVIFRSPFFENVKPSDRKVLARNTDYAIRCLWKRTGANMSSFAPNRTHSEALDFLARHPKLLKAVKHIFDEDCGSDKRISKFVSAGYAAAYMYLMASSQTDDEGCNAYQASDKSNEEVLQWGAWDKAQDFWVMLAGDNAGLKPLRVAIAALASGDNGQAASMAEVSALIAKAWAAYLENDKVKEDDLVLEYTQDGDGFNHLAEFPLFGGVDIGEYKKPAEETNDPSPEEIEQEKAKIDEKNGREPVKPKKIEKAAPKPAVKPEPKSAESEKPAEQAAEKPAKKAKADKPESKPAKKKAAK